MLTLKGIQERGKPVLLIVGRKQRPQLGGGAERALLRGCGEHSRSKMMQGNSFFWEERFTNVLGETLGEKFHPGDGVFLREKGS